jgi:hypothetical protein
LSEMLGVVHLSDILNAYGISTTNANGSPPQSYEIQSRLS